MRTIPLFQRISTSRLNRLCQHSLLQRFGKGAVLFRQGNPAEWVWVVFEGWVHLLCAAPRSGLREVVLFTITPREVFCGISAMEPGTYTASGLAGTDTRVMRIPAEAFHDAILHEPEFAYQALRLCGERIRHMARHYAGMVEPVPRRIVRTILRLQDQFGRELPVTHRELAQMSWTTTESAIRTVRRLKRAGFVTGSRGRLTVNRREALKRAFATERAAPEPSADNGS